VGKGNLCQVLKKKKREDLWLGRDREKNRVRSFRWRQSQTLPTRWERTEKREGSGYPWLKKKHGRRRGSRSKHSPEETFKLYEQKYTPRHAWGGGRKKRYLQAEERQTVPKKGKGSQCLDFSRLPFIYHIFRHGKKKNAAKGFSESGRNRGRKENTCLLDQGLNDTNPPSH